MKSHIDSRTVGIQQPRDGEFLLFNKSGSKVHISGLLHSLLQWKKNAASRCARGTGVGREGGGSACSQASGLLALSSSLFFLPRTSATKRKKITTAPTKGSWESFRCATSRKWPLSIPGGNCRAKTAAPQHQPGQSIDVVNDQFICETCAKCLHVVDLPTPKWDTPWIEKK